MWLSCYSCFRSLLTVFHSNYDKKVFYAIFCGKIMTAIIKISTVAKMIIANLPALKKRCEIASTVTRFFSTQENYENACE